MLHFTFESAKPAKLVELYRSTYTDSVLGFTPLMAAASRGDYHLVLKLIRDGADIYAQSITGDTALTIAVKHLAHSKLNLDQNKYENTIFHISGAHTFKKFLYAIKNKDYIFLEKQVKQAAIEYNLKNEDHENILMMACAFGDLKAAEIILKPLEWMDPYAPHLITSFRETIIGINFKNIYGNTALASACKNKKINVVEFLIKFEANINTKNNDDKTPLMLSCEAKDAKTAKLLLENKALINEKDKNGDTALTISCAANDLTTIDILMSGIQENYFKINNNGKTSYEGINILNHHENNNKGETALSILSEKLTNLNGQHQEIDKYQKIIKLLNDDEYPDMANNYETESTTASLKNGSQQYDAHFSYASLYENEEALGEYVQIGGMGFYENNS